MNRIEILIILFLVVNPILVLLAVNQLKRMIVMLRKEAEAMNKEVRKDAHEIRAQTDAMRIETSRALASMRKATLDELDAIKLGVQNIEGLYRPRDKNRKG